MSDPRPYDDVQNAIDDLRQAAIDARMVELGFTLDENDDAYTCFLAPSGAVGVAYDSDLTTLESQGVELTGRMVLIVSRISPYGGWISPVLRVEQGVTYNDIPGLQQTGVAIAAEVSACFSDIADAVGGLCDVPQEGCFDDAIRCLEAAANSLARQCGGVVAQEGGSTMSTSQYSTWSPVLQLTYSLDLEHNFSNVRSELAVWSSNALAAFRNNYFDPLDEYVVNLYCLVTWFVYGYIKGEDALWEQARANVMQTIADTTASLSSYARNPDAGGGIDWEQLLDIAKNFSKFVAQMAIIVGTIQPEAAPVAGSVGLMAQLVGDLADKAEYVEKKNPPELPQQDYTHIMATFTQIFSQLRSDLTSAEWDINDHIVKTLVSCDEGGRYFVIGDPLTPPDSTTVIILRDASGSDFTNLTAQGMSRCLCVPLEDIGETILAAKRSLANSCDQNQWIRASDIGTGWSGCYPTWEKLVSWLTSRMQNTANQINEAGGKLYTVFNNFVSADTNIANQLIRYGDSHVQQAVELPTYTSANPNDSQPDFPSTPTVGYHPDPQPTYEDADSVAPPVVS